MRHFKKIIRSLPWLGLIVAIFAVYFNHTDIYKDDPDRFFHLALARETAQAGTLYPDTIPQIVGLRWNEYFPEKEFLFHQATLLGYHLGGENGAILLILTVATGALVLLYFIATHFLPPYLSFLTALIVFCSPALLFRLFLLRSHTLAIFTFLLMQWGILSRRPQLLLAGAALFVLSYHAFYIVLACLLLSLLASLLLSPVNWRKNLQFHSWGFAGFAAGILLNPYFPSNIIMGWKIAGITALVNDPSLGIHFGEELYPILSNIFVVRFLYPILILLLSGGIWIRNRALRLHTDSSENHLYIVLLLAVFLGLCTQSPRAGEYAIPAASLALIFVFQQSFFQNKRGHAFALALVCVAMWFSARTYRSEFRHYDESRLKNSLAAAAAIPITAEKPHPMVYNCEWILAPYLYYQRPEARFIDILDPSLLLVADNSKSGVREFFNKGLVADPRHLMKNIFRADYLYCYNSVIVEQLQQDPSFRQIFPLKTDDIMAGPVAVYVFTLKPELPPQFVRSLDWFEWTNAKKTNYQLLDPQSAKIGRKGRKNLADTSYFNLGGELSRTVQNQEANDDVLCATVIPPPEEIAAHRGARYLGIGGGRNLRVWRNGRPLFASITAFETTRGVRMLIPIPPLETGDRLEIVACSAADSKYWGTAISFWKEDDLKQLCQEKAHDRNPAEFSQLSNWSFSQNARKTCIAPIAVPLAGH